MLGDGFKGANAFADWAATEQDDSSNLDTGALLSMEQEGGKSTSAGPDTPSRDWLIDLYEWNRDEEGRYRIKRM